MIIFINNNLASSLTRDVIMGDIEYQNGTVVQLAATFNIDVPVNRFVYYCILPMGKKAGIQEFRFYGN
ncbi:MAG: hypothetical protein GXX85_11205 [Ignavibacteria bacterium]|nr:hypothetical protein [Ignavibacteria bacterium]